MIGQGEGQEERKRERGQEGGRGREGVPDGEVDFLASCEADASLLGIKRQVQIQNFKLRKILVGQSQADHFVFKDFVFGPDGQVHAELEALDGIASDVVVAPRESYSVAEELSYNNVVAVLVVLQVLARRRRGEEVRGGKEKERWFKK